MNNLRIGLVGLDTSHVEAFASILNDAASPDHIPGARIACAFPGGSPDFPLSIDRVPGYTQKLRDRYGVEMLDSPRAVAERVDAVIHTTVDGRAHLREFSEMADLRRPTFIDKPFAITSADAREMSKLALRHGTPIFSSSSLRFAGALRDVLGNSGGGRVIGADFSGPLHLQLILPGYFWYGIHTVEMVYAVMGPGCESVRVAASADHEVAIGRWTDGRLGVARGNRAGNNAFTGVIHRERADQWVDCAAGKTPHAGLTTAIMEFFRGGPTPVPLDETLEIVRFLEAANESRDLGGTEVRL